MSSAPVAELEGKRRRAVKAGVLTALVVASAFLLGMLIQGCNSQRSTNTLPESNSPAPETTTPTNTLPIVEGGPGTNVSQGPATNAPPQVVEPVGAIVNEPPANPEVFEKIKPASALYTVKRGDTLARIARAHGTTIRSLKAANSLKSDLIFVGKKLKVPTAIGSAPD